MLPDEHVAQVVDAPAAEDVAGLQLPDASLPPDDLAREVRAYYALLKEDLERRVAEIEVFLGFTEAAEDLAVRVAKLEAFVGVKR